MTGLARQRALFALVCITWGCTWIAMKAGTLASPPALFVGTRWLAAGLAMMALRAVSGEKLAPPPRLWPRLVLVGALMVATNSVLNVYSLRFVESGLGSVINSAVTPLALLGFGIAAGQEQFSLRQALAIGLGVCGVMVLFGPQAATGTLDPRQLLGAFGVIVASLAYAGASILARPMMRVIAPGQLATWVNLSGGVILTAGSLALEPGATDPGVFDWGWAGWAGWLFLVGPAALGASTIYLILVRDWGPSRAGTYAFISPIIAVLLGVVLYRESVGPAQAIGMAMMLSAAALALVRRRVRSPSPTRAGAV